MLPSSASQTDSDLSQSQRHYIQSMEMLIGVVQELSLARDLDTIMAIVRRAARELTQADGATFVLKDGDYCYYADENAISPLWKGQRFPQEICIGGWCMRNQQAIVIEDVEDDARIPIEAYRPTFIKSLAMVPIRTQSPIGAIGNYWATPHRATPEELRLLQALADTTSVALENVQIYEELEQRVHDRTLQLASVNQELEAFAYSLSHDLRTPVTVISGFAGLLQLKHSAQLDREGRNYLEHITQATERIAAQITGMLALHQVKHAKLDAHVVDLSAIAQEIITDLKSGNPTRQIETTIADPLTAVGDPVLLRVVLENLLSNAWKYSAQRSRTQIEFGTIDSTFYIKDNGAGFDSSQMERLFEPFQRLHKDTEFSGIGIGLASVHRIIERHGGKIWAEAEIDRGATFFFTLSA